jgi:hypothetical protein
MSIPGVWNSLRRGAYNGAAIGYPFAGRSYYVGAGAPVGVGIERVNTIQDAVNLMIAKDVLTLGPGSYDEAVVIPVGLDNITIMGAGNRGDIGIAPAATDAIALVIEGSAANRTQGITLINVGLEGNGDGGGLHVLGNIRRIRAYGCKFEGGAFAVKLESSAAGSIGDTIFDDVELAWTTKAFLLTVSGGGDPVTQTLLKNSLLHNYSSHGVDVDATFAADLWIVNNDFMDQEDGSEPSAFYVDAAEAGTTGGLYNNRIPDVTAKISVAAGVERVGNNYQDGTLT